MLDQLNPIIQPEAVTMWPELLPGWMVVIALLMVGLTLVTFHVIGRHNKNQYRREGLAELEEVVQISSQHTLDDVMRIRIISRLLKRVALVAYPRQNVASLTGSEWSAFLDRTSGRKGFPESSSALMRAASYQSVDNLDEAIPSDGLDRLIEDARNWIGNHHA